MEKTMKAIRLVIGLIVGLFKIWRNKPASLGDNNMRTIEVGLGLAPQDDPEVANAQHRLGQIAPLPENQRKARASEVEEMEELVRRKKVIPRVARDKKALLAQVRKAEKEQ